MSDESKHKLRDFITEESRKGNVVFWALDELAVAPLDEFIAQPADGILYDLNRLPEVVMTFIDDPKWVNDYAVSMVIRRLREKQDAVAGIVKFWAEEVQRQGRGPSQVWWMFEAWNYAIDVWAHAWPIKTSGVSHTRTSMLQKIGSLVEHRNPSDRWRQYGVRVGDHVCPNVAEVPRLMERWCEQADSMTPEEAYKELMEIHPFVDGNGRVGKIVYNALKGTLDAPQMPPNFFNCANP